MATIRRKKSTIVRSTQGAQLLAVRAAFGMLERVSPTLGGRWALRLWCTPPRRRPSRSDPALPPGERFTTSVNGAQVVAEAWGNGPVTYLLHGWGGWRTQFQALVAPLVAAGQRVVALDAPGHGESGSGSLGGRRTTLPEIAAALTAVTTNTGPAHAVVAHSAGCNAAGVAVRDGLPVDRLVFLAPMADPMHHLPEVAHMLNLGPRTQTRFVRRLEDLVERDMADFNLPARAAEAAPGDLPPLLIVHDRGDRETTHDGAEAIASAWPGADLITTEGLGHRRILADSAVVAAVTDYVTAGLAVGAGTGVGDPALAQAR